MRKLKTIKDVVYWGMCVGCGACFALCQRPGAVRLVNMSNVGIRPIFNTVACEDCQECTVFCPGFQIDSNQRPPETFGLPIKPNKLVGPTFAVWEGHAANSEIRYKGSSGGILTALASYCLENENMTFVLHTGMDSDKPWLNKTVISRNRSELIANAGSRYATSSPCELINFIEDSLQPCVFIGKPCDAAAVAMARRVRPRLDANLGLVLSFFCAGTPCNDATLSLLHENGILEEDVADLRYRGEGWPGRFKVTNKRTAEEFSMTYMDSWSRVASQRPFRCHLCPDGLGELADITSGDAWNRYVASEENPGLSHVLVRSHQGTQLLRKAQEAGYVTLQRSCPADVIEAQGLVQRRREVFGRLLGMWLLGVPFTRFKGFNLFKVWLQNSPFDLLRTVLGTQRRLVQRGLCRPNPLEVSGHSIR